MLDSLNNFLRDLAREFGTTGPLVLGLVAAVFLIFTAVMAIRAFSSGDTKKGGAYSFFSILIIIISIIAFVMLRGMGKNIGKDLNSNYGAIALVSMVPTYVAHMKYKTQAKLNK